MHESSVLLLPLIGVLGAASPALADCLTGTAHATVSPYASSTSPDADYWNGNDCSMYVVDVVGAAGRRVSVGGIWAEAYPTTQNNCQGSWYYVSIYAGTVASGFTHLTSGFRQGTWATMWGGTQFCAFDIPSWWADGETSITFTSSPYNNFRITAQAMGPARVTAFARSLID